MVPTHDLDDAQTVLLATQLITESKLPQLQLLAAEQAHVLTPSLLYRQLLTYLPPDSENFANLVVFLKHIENGFKDISSLDETSQDDSVRVASVQEPRQWLHNLRLHNTRRFDGLPCDDELSEFLVMWLHKVEDLSGITASSLQLLEPFVASRPELDLWRNSYLVPLVKLRNELYPDRAEFLDIWMMEGLHGISGVKSLLQFAQQDGSQAQVGRDLDEVVSPWIYGASNTKRRRIETPTSRADNTSWRDVNDWIYETSRDNFDLAAKAFLDWNGPKRIPIKADDDRSSTLPDLLARYVQTGLALVTTSTGTGQDTNLLLKQLLDRAASLYTAAPTASTESAQRHLSEASKADLLENMLLQNSNPITFPSEGTFTFLDNCLTAQRILEEFKISLPAITIIDTALFGSEERQKQELLRILQQVPRLTRSEIGWPTVRQHLLTLQSDESPSSGRVTRHEAFHFLGRVPKTYLESEVLDVLIANGQYTTVDDIFLNASNTPLDQDLVRDHIVSAVYAAYDNASNGNRTRGGMKRASDILKAFQSRFPSPTVFTQIEHLIRATHSLSFYQLTLQHGVPFQPATIRIHHDPISLLEKVLAQNQKAYAKLDDLLEIGRNLVLANVPISSTAPESSNFIDERLFDAQHRITYLAITSALSDQDFDTAYSYITTRLATSPSQTSGSPFVDDTSWRAAYAAGKHRPSSSPKNLHDRITSLSKRMDLLSLALTLTPTPDSLSEVLATWRRCEEEMDSLKSQAVEEERVVNVQSRGDSRLPGGFAEDRDFDVAETRRMMEKRALGGSGPSYEEDAPMGLFDVARGAASAFRKTAFPLRSSGTQVSIKDRGEHGGGSGRESLDEGRTSGEYQRVRKRDMVSNMVTGGFVSGMSWVLGAAPPTQDER